MRLSTLTRVAAPLRLHKFYMQKQSSATVYLYPTEQQKNGALRGYVVEKREGRRVAEKAVQTSLRGWQDHDVKETAFSALPPEVQQRFQAVGIEH